MMNRSPLQLALIAIGIMMATFFITYWLGFGFSVAVMMLIAAAGFLTIVVVMMLGAAHGEGPQEAKDSKAVEIWNARVARRTQASSTEQNASESNAS
jgi:uncharacterized membrane protein